MAIRRTSRGQPQYLQFRPYRAIVATGGGRLSYRVLIRAFLAGFISWAIAGALATALAVGLSRWGGGPDDIAHTLFGAFGWIFALALVAGLIGGGVNALRR